MPLFTLKKTFSTTLDCQPSMVYEILTDYNSYFEWLPFFSRSKLLAQEGDLAIAEFEMAADHSRLAIECIHTRNKSVFTRKISGDVPVHEIVWSLSPAGNEGTEISIRIEPARTWSRFVPGSARYFRGDSYLQSLKSRAEMFAASPGDVGGTKVLEMFETEAGLNLWIMGKKYLLQPIAEDEND